jgi:hypothetical protein
MVNH